MWTIGEPDRPLRHLALPDPGVDLRPSPDVGPPGWVAFSPDGGLLYASGAGPTVAFDVSSGAIVRTFDGLGALALSPDGQTLAVRSGQTQVQLVDTATATVRATLAGHDGLVTAATFSDDGRLIATTSTDETVTVWDATSGAQLHVLEGHAGSVLGVVFAADPATLYSTVETAGSTSGTSASPLASPEPLSTAPLTPRRRRRWWSAPTPARSHYSAKTCR